MSDELPPELARRYTDVVELGSGAFGRVLKARDSQLGRPVALKILNAFRSADPEARARFEREAALFSRLASPHLPRVYDFGILDGTPHIVFELLTGESLARKLQLAGGRLPPETVLDFTHQMLDALETLHGAKVLHRDLKPDNVLVLESGGLALIDLGLGVDPDSETLTKTGAVVGTPAYLAPDLMCGGRWNESSDLYALALIALQALWGRLPLAGPTLMDTLDIRRKGPEAWIKAEGLPLSPAWVRGLVGALAVDPARRPRSAAALRNALVVDAPPGMTQITPQKPTALAAFSRPTPAPPGKGRPPLLPALLVLGALGGIAALLAPRGGPDPVAGVPLAAQAHAVETFRAAVDTDPVIGSALDLTSEDKDVEALSRWHKARAAYRRLVEQHELREVLATITPARVDRALAGHLGRILLVESLLGHSTRPGTPPLFEGEPPSGVEALFGRVLGHADTPELAAGKDPVLPEGIAQIEASLAANGASWTRIYSYRNRPDYATLPLRHQTRIRAVDPRGRPHQGWFTGESTQLVFSASPFSADSFAKFPFTIGCDLAKTAGDLVLAFDTQGFGRERPGWIELTGRGEVLALPVRPAPPIPVEVTGGQELHQLFLWRVPRALLPERANALRMTAIGLQPLGPSDPLVGIWHIWMLTAGPLPAPFT